MEVDLLTTVPRYKFKALALYLSIYIFCHFTILLHYILEANIVLCTPLNVLLTLVSSSFADLEPRYILKLLN